MVVTVTLAGDAPAAGTTVTVSLDIARDPDDYSYTLDPDAEPVVVNDASIQLKLRYLGKAQRPLGCIF